MRLLCKPGVESMATFNINPSAFLNNIPPSPRNSGSVKRIDPQLEKCKQLAIDYTAKDGKPHSVYNLNPVGIPLYVVRQAGLKGDKVVFTTEA